MPHRVAAASIVMVPLLAAASGCACQAAPAGGALFAEHMKRGREAFDAARYGRAHIAFARAGDLVPGDETAAIWADLAAVAVAAVTPERINDANINELDYAIDVLAPRFGQYAHLIETARGNVQVRAGRTDAALDAYRAAMAARPEFVSARFFFAQVLEQTGKAAEAEAALQTARKADASHVPLREALARLLLQRGAADDAVTVLQEALAVNARAETHLLMGRAQFARRDSGAAEAALKAALDADAGHAPALYDLAALYLHTGRKDAAAPLLARYLDVAPTRGESPQRIGEARQTLATLRAPPSAPAPAAQGALPMSPSAPAGPLPAAKR
jgi:tetratricopeptide (TPR) repeat protein